MVVYFETDEISLLCQFTIKEEVGQKSLCMKNHQLIASKFSVDMEKQFKTMA